MQEEVVSLGHSMLLGTRKTSMTLWQLQNAVINVSGYCAKSETWSFTYTPPTQVLTVELIAPPDGSVLVTTPITLKTRVTSNATAVEDATVKFYVNGTLVGSKSDTSGYASYDITRTPPVGSYTRYATAEKTGYKSGKSPTWHFTYLPASFSVGEYNIRYISG